MTSSVSVAALAVTVTRALIRSRVSDEFYEESQAALSELVRLAEQTEDVRRELTSAQRVIWSLAWHAPDHRVAVYPPMLRDAEMVLVSEQMVDRDGFYVIAQRGTKP